MKAGDVSPVLRSAAGFHIVKLIDRRSHNDPSLVDQTHARHILVRVNEITSEADAKAKIDRLKDRLEGGAKFEDMARLNSEDASSAKGGDLGWINPGDVVPAFEEALSKLALNQVSAPVRTPFGWHLIEVLERRKQDVTADRERMQAQLAIRQRKSEEAFQDWVRQTRDRAYVEMRVDERWFGRMDLESVFAEPLIELGAETPAFAGIYTPKSFHGATRVGVTSQFLENAEKIHMFMP